MSLQRLAAFLLRLYPPSFRRRFSAEWQDVVAWHQQQLSGANTSGFRAAFALMVDAARAVPAAHIVVIAERLSSFRQTGAALGDAIRRDVHDAVRSLLRSPYFTATAVLSLGLGIGASTGVFSVVNAVLLRPLPYHQPDQLVVVWNELPASGLERAPMSGIELDALQQRSDLFQDVGGIWPRSSTLIDDEGPAIVSAAFMTPSFLDVLGVEPAFGRGFVPDEPGAEITLGVILSDGIWRARFGADPDILGRSIRLDGDEVPIVGVMPPDFTLHFPPDAGLPRQADIYLPNLWRLSESAPAQRFFRVVARLRPGRTVAQANVEVARVSDALRANYADLARAGDRFSAVPLHRDTVSRARPVLLALLSAVGLLLLLAAANVASLLLARTTTRAKEMAIRISLGASRRRIAIQLLIESLLLTAAGAIAGLWLGRIAAGVMWALRPEGVAGVDDIVLDRHVLAFALLAAAIAGLTFGLAPLTRLPEFDPMHTLRRGSARGGPGAHRARRIVTAGEIALGVVLLAGATLMARTLVTLQKVDPGFDADAVVTFRISLPEQRFPSDHERAQLAQRLEDRLRAIPGAQAAGATSHLPYADWANWAASAAPEAVPESERQAYFADHRSVTPGYFAALGIRLLEGRAFHSSDDAAHEPVVIVDRAFAQLAFPGKSAIGKRIYPNRYLDGWFQQTTGIIVGVVEDTRDRSPAEPSGGQVFWPFAQSARWELTYAIRAAGDPLAVIDAARQAVRDVYTDLALGTPRLMRSYANEATADTRYVVLLAGTFAGLALAIAALGVFSVVTFSTAQRAHELGIRAALGADSRAIVGEVVGEGVRIGAWGIGVGLVMSLGLTRFLESLLYGVRPGDPVTLAVVVVTFFGVVVVAALRPALRATRVDPLRTMRAE